MPNEVETTLKVRAAGKEFEFTVQVVDGETFVREAGAPAALGMRKLVLAGPDTGGGHIIGVEVVR